MTTWSILIASIEHRADKLKRLLDVLMPQVKDAEGVEVLIYRDNLEASIGYKRQHLVESSTADYVSFIDDDDLVSDDYVAKVTAALAESPDYVGFRQRYTKDGVEQLPVFHSLQYKGGWRSDNEGFYRGITHFNPIRRELALLVSFEGDHGEDERWSQRLEATGRVESEVFIDEELSMHEESSSDGFATPREPLIKHPPKTKRAGIKWIEGTPPPEAERQVAAPSTPSESPFDNPAFLAVENMWRRGARRGEFTLAYRAGQAVPRGERPFLVTESESRRG